MTGASDQLPDRSLFIKGGRTGILLVHGLGGTPVEMRYVAQAFARQGYTVYCCQLAGHCGTPEELRRSTWQEWYASVETALGRLSQHCTTIFAGGLSMGAMLALHLAFNHQERVNGLLLYAPAFQLDGWAMPLRSWLLRIARPATLYIDFDLPERDPYGIKDERMRAIVVSGMQAGGGATFSTPLRCFANMNALAGVVRRNLKFIRQPTFIVHPRVDDMADLRNAFHLQRNLGGLVDCVVLDNSYHIVTLDQQRDIVADRSTQFVARVQEAIESGSAQRTGRTDKA